MSEKFNNVYLRTNMSCDGTIPEKGAHAESPDMFSNGTEALADFEKVLSTPESYSKQPEDKSTILRDNYCYLRCKNNTDQILSAKAQMFYTQASIVLWPDMWKPMTVDFKQDSSNDILNVPPGGIGVVERPFIWNKPPSVSTKDHYCYIGRLFTQTTPNPLPAVEHPIDMSAIIKTNLMYAQRNIQVIDIDPGYNGYYHTIISASKELQKPSKYHLFLYPHEMQGWEVEITCSMADSEGRKIGLKKIKMMDNDDIYCGQCLLEPGFTAVISVYFYGNGIPPTEFTKSKVVLEYAVQDNEVSYAKAMGIVDAHYSNRLMKKAGISDGKTSALTCVGEYTSSFQIKR